MAEETVGLAYKTTSPLKHSIVWVPGWKTSPSPLLMWRRSFPRVLPSLQNIAQLEDQVHSLREDLLQAHAQRKQQLMELGVLREEERQRAAQEQEATLGRLRVEMERLKQELEKTHAADKQLAPGEGGTASGPSGSLKDGFYFWDVVVLLGQTAMWVSIVSVSFCSQWE